MGCYSDVCLNEAKQRDDERAIVICCEHVAGGCVSLNSGLLSLLLHHSLSVMSCDLWLCHLIKISRICEDRIVRDSVKALAQCSTDPSLKNWLMGFQPVWPNSIYCWCWRSTWWINLWSEMTEKAHGCFLWDLHDFTPLSNQSLE